MNNDDIVNFVRLLGQELTQEEIRMTLIILHNKTIDALNKMGINISKFKTANLDLYPGLTTTLTKLNELIEQNVISPSTPLAVARSASADQLQEQSVLSEPFTQVGAGSSSQSTSKATSSGSSSSSVNKPSVTLEPTANRAESMFTDYLELTPPQIFPNTLVNKIKNLSPLEPVFPDIVGKLQAEAHETQKKMLVERFTPYYLSSDPRAFKRDRDMTEHMKNYYEQETQKALAKQGPGFTFTAIPAQNNRYLQEYLRDKQDIEDDTYYQSLLDVEDAYHNDPKERLKQDQEQAAVVNVVFKSLGGKCSYKDIIASRLSLSEYSLNSAFHPFYEDFLYDIVTCYFEPNGQLKLPLCEDEKAAGYVEKFLRSISRTEKVYEGYLQQAKKHGLSKLVSLMENQLKKDFFRKSYSIRTAGTWRSLKEKFGYGYDSIFERADENSLNKKLSDFVDVCNQGNLKEAQERIQRYKSKKATSQEYKKLAHTCKEIYRNTYGRYYTEQGILLEFAKDPVIKRFTEADIQKIKSDKEYRAKIHNSLIIRNKVKKELEEAYSIPASHPGSVDTMIYALTDHAFEPEKCLNILMSLSRDGKFSEAYPYFFDNNGVLKSLKYNPELISDLPLPKSIHTESNAPLRHCLNSWIALTTKNEHHEQLGHIKLYLQACCSSNKKQASQHLALAQTLLLLLSKNMPNHQLFKCPLISKAQTDEQQKHYAQIVSLVLDTTRASIDLQSQESADKKMAEIFLKALMKVIVHLHHLNEQDKIELVRKSLSHLEFLQPVQSRKELTISHRASTHNSRLSQLLTKDSNEILKAAHTILALQTGLGLK